MDWQTGADAEAMRAIAAEAIRPGWAGRRLLAVDGRSRGAARAVADGIAAALGERGAPVARADIGDFLRPDGGSPGARPALADITDVPLLRRVLVEPFRLGTGAGFQLRGYDAARGRPAQSAWRTAPEDAVLVVSGPLLHAADAAGLWHWSALLVAEGEATGSGDAADDDLVSPAAWAAYLAGARPGERASALLDASGDVPERVFTDFC